MVKRVLAFEAGRPSDDASHVGILTKLIDLYTRFATLVEAENVGRQEERAAIAQRTRLRGEIALQAKHLLHVVDVATESDPDIRTHFMRPNSNMPNRVFYGAVRSIDVRARDYEELLLALGLGTDFLADLAANLDAFDGASAASDDGRLGHIAARGELQTVASRCRAIIEVLDGLNGARYAKGTSDLIAWESARNIFGPVSRSEVRAGDSGSVETVARAL